MPRFLDLDTWKKTPSQTPLVKWNPVAVEKAEGEEPAAKSEKPLVVRISSESPDRDNDVIKLAGWRLDTYNSNPVILFAHNSWEPPVGTSTRVWIEGGFLKAEADFCTREEYEFGWMIGQMMKSGRLRAASVGFKPEKYAFNETRGGFAMDFEAQELLEWSPVPIPANPEALVEDKGMGLPTHLLGQWCERTLDMVRGKGFWVNGAELSPLLEATRKAAGTRPPAPEKASSSPATPPAPDANLVKGATDAEISAAITGMFKTVRDDVRLQLTGRLPD